MQMARQKYQSYCYVITDIKIYLPAITLPKSSLQERSAGSRDLDTVLTFSILVLVTYN